MNTILRSSTVASELSYILILDLHAVKEKQKVKCISLKEVEIETNSSSALFKTNRQMF